MRHKMVEPEFVLAVEPPTSGQNRFALSVAVVLFVVFSAAVIIGKTFPVALVPVRVNSFVPVLAALLLANDFFLPLYCLANSPSSVHMPC